MDKNNAFIQQTAEDYDIDYNDVKYIYDLWRNKGKFYEKLEDYLKTKT